MMKIALLHQKVGEDSFKRGCEETAASAFLRAAIYNHFAQMHEFRNVDLKLRAIQLTVENYCKTLPLFRNLPGKRVEFSFENIKLPAYLRVPLRGKKAKHPCVLLHGGLDSTKEELHSFQQLCVERGLGVLAFDGPGQGEVNRLMKARPDYEKAVSAIIDQLSSYDEIDCDRIAIIGRSAGGYYATRAAAFDKRIRACVAWGTLYEFDWNNLPLGTKEGFAWAIGKNDLNEAGEFSKSFSLAGLAQKITCPLYILHGRLDELFPVAQASRLAKEAKGPTDLVIEDEGGHCANNLAHLVRPKMADWLMEQLLPN
jgi:2,6-dihydroxypseudooxynicotine hydrolase